MELNIKQRKFIDNLFEGMTQGKAYTEAGYEAKFPDPAASRLIRNDKVVNEIERRLSDINIGNRISLGRISKTALEELLVIIQNKDIDDKTKLDAIKDALDRAGLKPTEQHKIDLKGKIEAEMSKEQMYELIGIATKAISGESLLPSDKK